MWRKSIHAALSLGLLTMNVFSPNGQASVAIDYAIPSSKYTVRVERDLMVPMRDGVKLATDLYFPVGLAGPLPVIVIRTPYDKLRPRAMGEAPRFFSGQGFIVVVQDVRGKFGSEGEYIVSASDTNDGYDTLSWIAAQPWSDGKIGTYGCSYLGENQIELAKTRHPNLTTMIPQAAGGAVGSAGGKYTYFGEFEGGVFGLSTGYGWFPKDGRRSSKDIKSFSVDTAAALRTLPITDMVQRYGGPKTDFEGFVSHDLTDPWWQQFGYISDHDRFSAPALQINSWFDYGVSETLQLMDLMSKNSDSLSPAHRNQFIIIAPTGHCGFQDATQHTVVGALDVGDARFPYWKTYLEWYDFWLREKGNEATKAPRIRYYLMGANKWLGTDQFPPKGTTYKSYYLRSSGTANSRLGNGILALNLPKGALTDQFIYNPLDPVPSRGGSLCCTGNPKDQPGSFDQSSIEDRTDVLVYSSRPLKQSVDVVGPLAAILFVSSSARDTDFTAKLVDVWPDGRAFNIQEGILRARYRRGVERDLRVAKGKVYELRIDLHATAYRFASGHKIRIEISSSNFPRFARNLNTGGDNYRDTVSVKANNAVYHSTQYPSRLVLPISDSTMATKAR